MSRKIIHEEIIDNYLSYIFVMEALEPAYLYFI
jgi:hypothetical protein